MLVDSQAQTRLFLSSEQKAAVIEATRSTGLQQTRSGCCAAAWCVISLADIFQMDFFIRQSQDLHLTLCLSGQMLW